MSAKGKPAKPVKDEKSRKASKVNLTKPDEMSPEVLEFLTAIDDYKRQYERPFPSWSEVFEIVKGLGYTKAG